MHGYYAEASKIVKSEFASIKARLYRNNLADSRRVQNIETRQKKVIEEFLPFQSWEDRYKHLINFGRRLPDLEDSLKTEEAKVKGCQSQVWLHAKLSADKRIIFQGDSDALIVKGLVAILLQIYSDSTPEEILQTPPDFIKAIGFEGNLSPSRANGLYSMLKQIRNFAVVFQHLSK